MVDMVVSVNVTCNTLSNGSEKSSSSFTSLGYAAHWVGIQPLHYHDMTNDNDYNKMSSAVFALAFEVFYCPLHL
jgi:hypothetical protein